MKWLIVFTLALTMGSNQIASAWETLVSCDGNKMIIEMDRLPVPSQYGGGEGFRTRYQMVIRDAESQNIFANNKAYGYYQHPGKFFGAKNGSGQFNEMVVMIDGRYDWGFSGRYDYGLDIPYISRNTTPISYYVNIYDNKKVVVKAHSPLESVYKIVPKGDLASVEYNNCWIR